MSYIISRCTSCGRRVKTNASLSPQQCVLCNGLFCKSHGMDFVCERCISRIPPRVLDRMEPEIERARKIRNFYLLVTFLMGLGMLAAFLLMMPMAYDSRSPVMIGLIAGFFLVLCASIGLMVQMGSQLKPILENIRRIATSG